MSKQRRSYRGTRFAALALLASGTLFSTCTSRFKESAVDGATRYVFTLLDPLSIAELFLPDDAGASDGV